MANDLNYPDVLGYITDNTHLNVNVLQVAAAISPRVVRAGRPLEMHVLLQNASDAELEVIATLRVPDRDAKKQKERFVTKADRLRIGLPPAGVGLVILPVSTLPDTAPGAGYKIGMDVKMKPVQRGRPSRVRDSDGGTTFDPATVPDDIQAKLEELKGLKWGIDSPTLRGATIETALTVMSGKVGSFANLEPSWTSLWTLKDLADERPLLQRLAPVIKERVLPKFAHQHAYPLILDATQKYFGKSAYAITDLEMQTIARLIYVPLAYAGVDPRKMVLSDNKRYNLVPYLASGYLDDPAAPLNLPPWFSRFLKLLNSDDRMVRNPVKGLVHLMFDDLVTDALRLGLNQIAILAEVDMGNTQEQSQYVDFVMDHVKDGKLNFDLLYVPAVVGGVSIADDTLGRGEQAAELAYAFQDMLEKRSREVTEDNQATYDIANTIVEIFAKKYIAR